MRAYMIAPLLMVGTALADKVSGHGISLKKFNINGAETAPGEGPRMSKDGTSVTYGLAEFDAYIAPDSANTPIQTYAYLTLWHPKNMGVRVARHIIQARVDLPANVTAYIATGVNLDSKETNGIIHDPVESAALRSWIDGGDIWVEKYLTVSHDFGSEDMGFVGCGERKTIVSVITTLEITAEGDAVGGVFMSSRRNGKDLQEIQLEWAECE